MIATFWNVLFKYVDRLTDEKETYEQLGNCYNCTKAHEKCHMTCYKFKQHIATVIKGKRLKTARDIETLLQAAYDDGTEYRVELENYKPETEIDKAACSVRGLKVFKYNGHIHYELDGRHLDTPKEVIEHLKEIREGDIMGLASEEKRRVLEDITAMLEKYRDDIKEMSIAESIGREEYGTK